MHSALFYSISSTMISRLMLNLRDPNLVRKRHSGELGMGSTAGVCPNISTFVQPHYPQYPEDGWVPTDIVNATYESDEENDGYRGPGRPHASKHTYDADEKCELNLWISGIQTHAIQITPVDYRL